ncbi:MAG TPA: glycoside hydrolase family 88 protein, partial [Bacteroidota bacterium]|nr:glycoside hydrolase family 88 protein [Bacteroidota bacterium]
AQHVDSLATAERLRAIVDRIISEATFDFADSATGKVYASPAQAPAGSRLVLKSRYNDWRYWNGVLNIAVKRAAESLNDTNGRRFAQTNVAFCFDHRHYFEERYKGESKWSYPLGQFFLMEELDDCGAMGAGVIETYESDPQPRYRTYIDRAANHIAKVQARLDDGTLVRGFPRKWTLWADDLYMSVSFLSRMGELSGDVRYFDDAARQVINFHKYLFDPKHGLMFHCWFSDSRTHGIAFWGRANGWVALAQVDLLDRLPVHHPSRDTLLAIFRRDIDGLTKHQDSDGLWHQLLDKQDSYEETSCSAMFTYAIARGVGKGYLGMEYKPIAVKGWKGVASRIRLDGKIEGVCAGTGVGDSLEFYYKRPTPLNDPHGIGAVLLAGAEMLRVQ